eukprot:1957283-Amphidinium_carterae.1
MSCVALELSKKQATEPILGMNSGNKLHTLLLPCVSLVLLPSCYGTLRSVFKALGLSRDPAVATQSTVYVKKHVKIASELLIKVAEQVATIKGSPQLFCTRQMIQKLLQRVDAKVAK